MSISAALKEPPHERHGGGTLWAVRDALEISRTLTHPGAVVLATQHESPV